ncbi:MAG: PEP-utilizing enzyme [Actinomycetota bacterium]|nr:PEP-utilizing enzyme [Actinomycetota bacterium]
MSGNISIGATNEDRLSVSVGLGAPDPEHQAVVELSDGEAAVAEVVGAKAAALARATLLGLPVLPGFAITTPTVASILASPNRLRGALADPLRVAWSRLSERGSKPVVVRSSSVAEDGSESSMAGMFTSVIDVYGWPAFLSAVLEVAASSRIPGSKKEPAPMGVLVQPYLEAKLGGVMFGVDPVTGSRDRLVVATVSGGPDRLVSGAVQGTRYTLRRNGRLVEAATGSGGAALGGWRRRALAHLAARTERSFGGPQDVEWAIDLDGSLWLLQSRPVTATGASARPTGPVLGPGPVAETFPRSLSLLEEHLWVEPLREALTHALLLVRTASPRKIKKSPVVTTVEGRVAADLELLGDPSTKKSFLKKINPIPPARRLAASWNVGRLRAGLPVLVEHLVASVDDELSKVPSLAEATDESLVDMLERGRQTLVALHGHEVLAGMLMAPGASAPTAASLALRSLAEARAAGEDDDRILMRHPVVLALSPPAVFGHRSLPAIASLMPDPSTASDPLALARERARLRARWVQEFTARVSEEIGSRAARAGALQDRADVKLLTPSELERVLKQKRFPAELDRRATRPESPPLPARFRLTNDGNVVAELSGEGDRGQGAGGGRARAVVSHDPEAVHPGEVLVVRTLDPDLAPVLPGLAGLMAETGSVLSHLAILAREFGVPTVVGVSNALQRFPTGSTVIVDGTTGEVSVAEEHAA